MAKTMKRYNFLEILLSALPWAIWLAMLGVMLGGYWTKFLDEKLRGYELMAMGCDTTMIMAFIGLALLFVDNVVNHLLKMGDHDSHNVIFQSIVLVYALPYLITLFVIGYDEDIAWYPFSYFLCYLGAGACDLLFALFYNLSASDYVKGEHRARRTRSYKPHRTHSSRKKKSKLPFPLEPDEPKELGTRTAYKGLFVNTIPAVDLLEKAARKAIEDETYLHLQKKLTLTADCEGEPRLDGKRNIYVCDSLVVSVLLTDDDFDWLAEYVDTKFKGTRFLNKARDVVAASGVDPEEVANGKHPKVFDDVMHAIWDDYNERIVSAGAALNRAVASALDERFRANTSGNDWMAYCGEKKYMGSRAIDLKNARGNANFVFSKSAYAGVTSSFSQEFTSAKIADIALEFLHNYKKRELDRTSKKYAILDSNSQLEYLSTFIALYIGDRMHEVHPEISYTPVVDMPITATAKRPIQEDGVTYYDSIKFDLHFTAADAERFEEFCRDYNNGVKSENYGENGIKFFRKHLVPAVDKFLEILRENGTSLGARPSDKSSPYWAEREPEGKEPTPMSKHFQYSVTAHWTDMPKNTFLPE